MNINQILDQTELNLIIRALHVYKLEQENDQKNRAKQGWDTNKQSERMQQIDDIAEKLFEFID